MQVRHDVRSWLAQHWNPELGLAEWRTRLADSGWACPSWPAAWCGRGLPVGAVEAVSDEIAKAGAIGIPEGVGMHLAAPTILEHGAETVKARFLRKTVTGEFSWCQLFSEPGAGSDLAGLTTRADRDGDEWIVRGQKVWNTSAAHADFGLLLARTDWDVPKHRGITYFVLPMRQPGVEVRPLRQMNGHASFNEVFLDDARVPADHVVGQVNGGWSVALTTLAHERRLAPIGRGIPAGAREGRAVREAAEEIARVAAPYRWYPQRAGRVDLVVPRAEAAGRAGDPRVRQEIGRLLSLARASQWTAQRAAAARARGRPPGPEGSLGKLASSNIARTAAAVHTDIAGASGMLAGPEAPLDGTITEILLSVPAISIAGGTDEIQHNIIGERVLGLPKEPEPARDLPFREVRTNSAR
ncbi:MAG: acyl-CoA dehydrogenase family protein [Acidimicrobiales bacterium]|nr:acyl-CoA dehydrogenase family protein [Acidimicrobiales bacterium]